MLVSGNPIHMYGMVCMVCMVWYGKYISKYICKTPLKADLAESGGLAESLIETI